MCADMPTITHVHRHQIEDKYIKLALFNERREPVRTRVRSQAHNNLEHDPATQLILLGVSASLEAVVLHLPRKMFHASLWEHIV